MFRYRNVMIASFTLFFFSILVHVIYSCLVLPKEEVVYSVLCGGTLFSAPLVFVLSGKLKRAQPYVLVTFFDVSCLVLSVINRTAFYMPVLFAAAVVICGFFLSSKLCLWYLVLTDVTLIANVLFFLPKDQVNLISVYLVVCLCYNLSGLGMTLFVQVTKNNIMLLKKQNKRLLTVNRQNDRFWAASAGKMRSVSQGLSEICTGLLGRSDIPLPVREQLSRIQSDAGRLSIALNDAEDYALIENNEMRIKSEPYTFNSLMSDIANFCYASSSKKELDVIMESQPDIPSVLIGDCRRITQIIMSLFANSVKFTEKGSITVSFSSRITPEGVNLQIQVKDTGIGITPQAANKIFTVYADENNGKSSIHLGLGVAKRLTSLMGGFIFVRNEKTGGSKFVVTIPQKVENPLPFSTLFESTGKEYKVLLYLKSGLVAASAKEQLEKLGVKAHICRSRVEFMLEKDSADITHIYSDYSYYGFDKPIFDMLARVKKVVVACGRGETEAPLSKQIKRVLRPLHMAMFVHIFNKGPVEGDSFVQGFIAPDISALVVGDYENKLSTLKNYQISADFISPNQVIESLKEKDYDIIFLCDNIEIIAARIMCAEEEKYMNIPVIAVGETNEGCSERLPSDFTHYELNGILERFIPEGKQIKTVPDLHKRPFDELNPARGLAAASGSKSAYREMLEIFEERAEESAQTLENSIKSKNFEDCVIQLQGIRSSAANIGAVSVSEIARQAQAAAEKQEYKLLKELTQLLSAKFVLLEADINRYFTENGITNPSDEELYSQVEKIKAALDKENTDIAADLLRQLLDTHLGYGNRIMVKSALSNIESHNNEKALSYLDKLSENIPYAGGKVK